jgi:flagellar basal body-associated protein FliL
MSKTKNSSKMRSRRKNGSLLTNPLFVIMGGLILVAVALFVILRANQPSEPKLPPVNVDVSGAPSLQVDKEKVDLGDVPVDQTVTVSFQLANAGDQTLRFSEQPYIEVKEGC